MWIFDIFFLFHEMNFEIQTFWILFATDKIYSLSRLRTDREKKINENGGKRSIVIIYGAVVNTWLEHLENVE